MLRGSGSLLWACAATACAISLDPEVVDTGLAPVPLADACSIQVGERSIHGALRESIDAAGEPRWFADSLLTDHGVDTNVVLTGRLQPDCSGLTVLAIETLAPPVAVEGWVVGLDAVAATDTAPATRAYAAFAPDPDAPFGARSLGTGMATAETLSGPWTPGPLLFGAGYPAYGAALRSERGLLHAYGCVPARFLDADCTMAVAEDVHATNVAAYTYWLGSDRLTDRIDAASVMLSGGTEISIRGVDGELWMATVPPLGTQIVMRRGVGPAGPWSAPRTVARCAAPVDGYCSAVSLLPSVQAPPGQVAVSYAVHAELGGPSASTRLGFVQLP